MANGIKPFQKNYFGFSSACLPKTCLHKGRNRLVGYKYFSVMMN